MRKSRILLMMLLITAILLTGCGKKDAIVVGENGEKEIKQEEYIAAAQKDGKWGYIDKTGKEIIDFNYDEAGLFVDGVAPVKKVINGAI